MLDNIEEAVLLNLVKMSNQVGSKVDYIQGGGGNTSVKLDDHRMLVKSSGTLLKDLSNVSGYVEVDYPSVCELLNKDIDNDHFADLTKEQMLSPSSFGRPSIETGFHALLGKYVLHSHSVYANVINCQENAKEILASFDPNWVFVEYDKPGLELTRLIRDAVQGCDVNDIVIFLQNHGLIVAAKCVDDVLEKHESVNKIIKENFTLDPWGDNQKKYDLQTMRERVLFPDQVVFTHQDDEALLNSDAGKETIQAYNYIYHQIEQISGKHRFLSDENIAGLLGMKSEKYRQQLAK